MVNMFLTNNPSPDYSRVEGWEPIPFVHEDSEWPMPALWAGAEEVFELVKHIDMTNLFKNRVENEFRNPDWLKTKTLDEVGQ